MNRRLCALALLLVLQSIAMGFAMASEITISKAKRTLLYQNEGKSQVFKIALGSSPIGAKSAQGDRKTPEGVYFITHKNDKSKFYLSLGLSYPNLSDADFGLESRRISRSEYAAIEKAAKRNVLAPQGTALGGNIFIHGGGSETDWTWGCIALSNADMLFLFENASIGDRVTILE
jgi:murein L,D-transpeptidase YafK